MRHSGEGQGPYHNGRDGRDKNCQQDRSALPAQSTEMANHANARRHKQQRHMGQYALRHRAHTAGKFGPHQQRTHQQQHPQHRAGQWQAQGAGGGFAQQLADQNGKQSVYHQGPMALRKVRVVG